jgi:hypothetical protein
MSTKSPFTNPAALFPLAIVALATLGAIQVQGQMITVTTGADVTDIPSTATMAQLPGPDGVVSFREALRVSDNQTGRQTIGFAIPQEDCYLPDIFDGICLIQGSLNWSAFESVTLDGTTQTAFAGDTFPDGNEVCLYGLTLNLNADDNEMFGFHDTRVSLNSSNNDVHHNTGDMDIRVYFGSGNFIHDNGASNIGLNYADDNLVVRNTTDRVRVTGLGMTNPATGNIIGGPDVADRNFITGFGNYGEHGVPAGHGVELFYTEDTLIQNNYIGTTPDGMAIANPACTTGILVLNNNFGVQVHDNLIAVQAVGVGPALGAQFGAAMFIEMYEGGSLVMTGNTLGLNALGEPVLGAVNGIWIPPLAFEEGADITIGGPNPDDGNVIAGHSETGVLAVGAPGLPLPGHVRLTGNAIYGNGQIGIDLTPNNWTFGMTPNDALDVDLGANGLQNFPVLDEATRTGDTLHVTGMLSSKPLTQYTIEFFASSVCGVSGFGEGELFLESVTVTTDASGDAEIDAVLGFDVSDGEFVSATATADSVGETSEFSQCLAVSGGGLMGDMDVDGDVDLVDFASFQLCFTGPGGTVSEGGCALTDFDGDGDCDLVDFNAFQLAFTGAQ